MGEKAKDIIISVNNTNISCTEAIKITIMVDWFDGPLEYCNTPLNMFMSEMFKYNSEKLFQSLGMRDGNESCHVLLSVVC